MLFLFMTYKEKASQWLSNPANRFVLSIFGIYGAWKVIQHYLLHGIWIGEWKHITNAIGTVYASATSRLLHIVGQHTIQSGIAVIFPTGDKILVEEHCLAIPAMILFAGTIALFSGSWKNKLWFIPMGLSVIIAINLLRLVFICITFEHFSKFFFELNHVYIYVAITYSAILGMILIWMNRYSEI
jgi:exosortase/archaeosortase family protein